MLAVVLLGVLWAAGAPAAAISSGPPAFDLRVRPGGVSTGEPVTITVRFSEPPDDTWHGAALAVLPEQDLTDDGRVADDGSLIPVTLEPVGATEYRAEVAADRPGTWMVVAVPYLDVDGSAVGRHGWPPPRAFYVLDSTPWWEVWLDPRLLIPAVLLVAALWFFRDHPERWPI